MHIILSTVHILLFLNVYVSAYFYAFLCIKSLIYLKYFNVLTRKPVYKGTREGVKSFDIFLFTVLKHNEITAVI